MLWAGKMTKNSMLSNVLCDSTSLFGDDSFVSFALARKVDAMRGTN